MKDTDFYVPKDKQSRFAKVYKTVGNELELFTFPNLGISNEMKQYPAFESGGAGLASTIDDYARFTQMLLNRGTLDGKRILSERTAQFMTCGKLEKCQQQTFDDWIGMDGFSYANLVKVMHEPERACMMCSKGNYGWDGWLGTNMINDPVENMTILIMHQKVDSGTTEYTRRIHNIAYAALEGEEK